MKGGKEIIKMVKQNNNVLLLVGLMVIVGAITSVVISVGITGNIIKVNPDFMGKNYVYTVADMQRNYYNNSQVYTKVEIDSLIRNLHLNPLNTFDLFNARCKWYQANALNVNGIIPDTYCDNLAIKPSICIDALGVDFTNDFGGVEGVVSVNCNTKDLHQTLFIRCCDARPLGY